MLRASALQSGLAVCDVSFALATRVFVVCRQRTQWEAPGCCDSRSRRVLQAQSVCGRSEHGISCPSCTSSGGLLMVAVRPPPHTLFNVQRPLAAHHTGCFTVLVVLSPLRSQSQPLTGATLCASPRPSCASSPPRQWVCGVHCCSLIGLHSGVCGRVCALLPLQLQAFWAPDRRALMCVM
jgi:hypothetical protein